MRLFIAVIVLGFIGDPTDGIGYIDLSGFANDAGREVRYAIRALQHGAAEIAAANEGGGSQRTGLASFDPTKLKVRISCNGSQRCAILGRRQFTVEHAS